jgi:hypothetical protein
MKTDERVSLVRLNYEENDPGDESQDIGQESSDVGSHRA